MLGWCNNSYSKGFWISQNLRDSQWDKSGDWNSLFTHCLRRHEKRSYAICVTLWFSVWTSQGLNLGPPDYESVKVRFFKISRNFLWIYKWLIHNNFITLQSNCEILRNLKKHALVFARCSHGVRKLSNRLSKKNNRLWLQKTKKLQSIVIQWTTAGLPLCLTNEPTRQLTNIQCVSALR